MADVRIKDLTEIASEASVADSLSVAVDSSGGTRRLELDTLRDVMARDIAAGDIEAAPQDVTITAVATTTYTLQLSDRNTILHCTHVDGCTVTLPDDTLPAGWTCGIMQGDADDVVTIALASPATALVSSDFADPPATVDQGDLIIVTVITAGASSVYKVGGDLAAV